MNNNTVNLNVLPFSSLIKGKIPKIPKEVQTYINAPKLETGKYFTLVIGGKSRDTGEGMEYSSQLQVLYKDKCIYDTGLMVYRHGRSMGMSIPDNWDRYIVEVKILSESGDQVLFGYKSGTGVIRICVLNKKGSAELLYTFDLPTHEDKIKSQVIPQTDEEFKSWIFTYLQASRMHVDIYHTDEKLCVVVNRYYNRDFDATHVAYQVVVWVKGSGVAISEKKSTRAKSTATKFSSNYLRCTVSLDEATDILFSGKSEYRDADISEQFHLVYPKASK